MNAMPPKRTPPVNTPPPVCQARVPPGGPACGARAEWVLPLAGGLIPVHACQKHRDGLARVFAAMAPDPERWVELILRGARRLE